MSLTVKKDVTREGMNELVRKAALQGDLVNQIHYQVDPELVSSDIIGDTCCSVFDSNATIASNDKRNVVLYAWYDNEFGYRPRCRLEAYGNSCPSSRYLPSKVSRQSLSFSRSSPSSTVVSPCTSAASKLILASATAHSLPANISYGPPFP
jgi:hypothetical protein